MNVRERLPQFTFDYVTAVMVLFVLVFQVSAVLGAAELQSALASMPTESQTQPVQQSSNASHGLGIVVIVIVESLLLIAVWRLWSRLPKWVRTFAKVGAVTTFVAVPLTLFYLAGAVWSGILVLGIFAVCIGISYGLYELLARYDLDWIFYNFAGGILGVIAAVFFGTALAPVAIIPMLVLLLIWDHVAVNLTDIMDGLIDASGDIGLPSYFIIPTALKIDLDDVIEYVDNHQELDSPDGIAGVIGIGDFSFPAILTVSTAVAGNNPLAITTLLGTVAGIIALRDTHSRASNGLPALLWVNTGALIGFAAGIVFTGITLTAALGVVS